MALAGEQPPEQVNAQPHRRLREEDEETLYCGDSRAADGAKPQRQEPATLSRRNRRRVKEKQGDAAEHPR